MAPHKPLLLPSYILMRSSRRRTSAQEQEGLHSHLSWDQTDVSTIFSRVPEELMIVWERQRKNTKWKFSPFGSCSTLLSTTNRLFSQSKRTMIIPNSAIKKLSFLGWIYIPVPIPENTTGTKYLTSTDKWKLNRSLNISEKVCDFVI